MTFFTAPPSSQPITSSLVYGPEVRRGDGLLHHRGRASSSVQATTAAAGWPTAISPARFGPVTTTTRLGSTPATSAITSLIRLPVPSSMPFIRLTRVASGSDRAGVDPAGQVARSVCDGTREHDQVGAVQRLRRVAWSP